MKCISLWQPYASAVALGLKKIETRSWMTYYSGPIAIHAAKLKSQEVANAYYDLCATHNDIRWAFEDQLDIFETLPFGAIIAVGELVQCVHMKFINFDKLSAVERALGIYTKDRWAWILKDIRPLKNPIPFKGKQGIFNVESGLLNIKDSVKLHA